MALVARVVATTNTTSTDLLASFRPTITLYRIHVRQFADRTRSWCVLRRYSEFAELHSALFRLIPSLPTLPPKLLVNTAEALADRYLGLDAFLRMLLATPTAASHARVRSFLGADNAIAPRVTPFSGASLSPQVEDDWDHDEPSALSPAHSFQHSSAGDGGSRTSERGETDAASPAWLLTGTWVADEARSRDSLEPMLRAMGTPWAARRMVRGLRIVTALAHEPGARLIEVASSSLGEGKPSVFHLDGETRPLQIGRREGAVRAVELARYGAVRLEITLPDGKGTLLDTRRVLPNGHEIERIIELRLVRQPPLRLHRLLVRESPDQQPVPRPLLHAGAAAPALAQARTPPTPGSAGGPVHTESAALRRALFKPKAGRVYRHERLELVFRYALSGAWRLLAGIINTAAAMPLAALFAAVLVGANLVGWGLVETTPSVDQLAVALLAPAPVAPESPRVALPADQLAEGPESRASPAPQSSHAHQALYQVSAQKLLLGIDALASVAAVRMLLWRH